MPVDEKIDACRETGETALDLFCHGLNGVIPPKLFELKHLQSLNLRLNDLHSLPPEIGKLTSLTTLNLGHNNLESLPPEIGKLVALQELKLGDNHLLSLPPEIAKLTALQELELSNNNLPSLPPEIGMLTALEKLTLYQINLQSLPLEIGMLATLRTLDLRRNNLQFLPPEIGKLVALQKLDLDFNNLQSLPPEIAKLADFLNLYILQNPLEEPPLQIASGGIRAIRDYYDLKDRKDAVVGRSSRASVYLGRTSRLARWETRVAVTIALGLLAADKGTLVWTWLLFSPLFLLRTEKSIVAGLRGYGWLVRKLRVRSTWAPWLLPFRLLLLGIGSLAVKFGVTLWYGWRSLSSVPGNYRHLTQCVDMFSPPELVAGAEAAHGRDRYNVFVLDELKRTFTILPDEFGYQFEPVSRQLTFGAFFLWPFFAFAWIYRWSVKATAFVYFPFLLFYQFEDEARERVYAIRKATNGDRPKRLIAAMIGLSLLSIIGLAQINDAVSLQVFLEDIAGDHWAFKVSSLIAPVTDKVVFSCLLFLSGFYLASRVFLMGLSHAIGQFDEDEWAHAIATKDAPHRWYGLVKFSWAGFKTSACVFVVVMLTVALPRAGKGLIWIWDFLF